MPLLGCFCDMGKRSLGEYAGLGPVRAIGQDRFDVNKLCPMWLPYA